MSKSKSAIFLLSLIIFLTPSLWGWDKKDSSGFLQPGRRIGSSIILSEDQISYSYRTFKIRVSEKVFKMDIKIDNSPADLDIYVNYNREIVNYDDVDFSSTLELFNEKISLSRMSSLPLETGVYYIDVVYPLERLPLIDDQEAMEIPFGVTVKLTSFNNPQVLEEGEVYNSYLAAEGAAFKLFAIDVSEEDSHLRVDLYNTKSDLDMFVTFDKPAFVSEEADYLRESYLGQESVVIGPDSPQPLRPGRYYISVFDRIEDDLTDHFSIEANFSPNPPGNLLAFPSLPRPVTHMDRAVAATVEISTETGSGSGCLISSEGHIITGLHVIRGSSGEVPDEVFVSMTLSPYDPAVELFKAEVIDVRREEDLALLKITTGFYGQALPSAYQFPHFDLSEKEVVQLGEELMFLGYPQIGGEGSRVSISLTRGIVSGFNRTDYGYLIKTDGEINSGNSGGSAFDKDYRLIGFPMSVISDEGGQIAFIHPLSMIPEEWLEELKP